MTHPHSTHVCVDCGAPVPNWKAKRCRACYLKRSAPPLYEPNTSGLCRCGCGQPTPIATRNDRKYGIVKGQPIQFLTGHHRRLSPVDYVVEDRGYKTPCWIWQLNISPGGYGQYAVPGGKGKSIPAHVEMYQRKYGPVPAGRQLDHLCRVRACCNPDHVEPVTVAVNIRRGSRAKLSDEQVAQIRALKGTMSTTKIGELFGVSGAHICNILNGKSRR